MTPGTNPAAGLLQACLRTRVSNCRVSAVSMPSVLQREDSIEGNSSGNLPISITIVADEGYRSIYPLPEKHSKSIIPARITATAANACGFLLTPKSKAPRN